MAMRIESLHLTSFRNFEDAHIEFCPGVNVFYGHNGSGKTNLLEALYVCSLGRSQRTANDAAMVRDGNDIYRVECGLISEDNDYKVAVAYQKGGRKKVTVDGVGVRLSQLFRLFSAVSVGPEDSEIVSGSPGKRRTFIDIHLSQLSSSYLDNLTDYLRCVSQRNAALKNGADPSPFDELMVTIGSKVMVGRAEYIAQMTPMAAKYYRDISSGGELTIEYTPKVPVEATASCEEIEAAFNQRLRMIAAREQAAGVSLIGPHRDEATLTINNLPARTHGSQGEWRTAAIALKLAAYNILRDKRETPPVLLLDEIFAELDDRRTEALIAGFEGFSQLFLTTATRPPQALHEIGRSFRIETGRVAEIQ
ncbi:MAG TPA: DNA replication/repair protein RecF [candidate division Zixibacteria bacterium]|nr:DNA replication/repair protein RecF [candidate division Zixibacteria bacterium]